MNILPTLETVSELARSGQYTVLPVSCEILSDFTTPIEVLRVLKNISTHCYLLESAKANETFGRYSDGGSGLALFSRPTIELANSVCTATDLFSETIPVGIDELMLDEIADTSEVLSVEYYDLSGIRVTTLLPKKIYIEKTLFRNGQVQVRKTTYRHSQIQDP